MRVAKPAVRAVIALGLACAGLVAATLFWASQQQLDATRWVTHTHEVLSALNEVKAAVAQIEVIESIPAAGRSLSLQDEHERASQVLARASTRVRSLTSDNERQQQRLDALQADRKSTRLNSSH